MRLTLADTVAVRARSQPGHEAIRVLGGTRLTYAECWRRVVGLAEVLRDAPAGPHGAMVGLLLPNGADAVLAFLACQMAGVAAVPINSRLAPPEIRFILEDSGAAILLTADPFLATGVPDGVRVIDAATVSTPASVPRAIVGENGSGAATGVVGYTSGTTGFPKGALWSNDHWLTHLMRWGWEFGLTAEQVLLVPGPLFHLSYAGLSLAALAIGARVDIMPAFEPGPALDELSERATFAFLVPAMTGMLLEEWRRRGEPEVAAFRFMISSGAPGPLSMTKETMRMLPNARVTEAYGWTEGGWVTFEVKRAETLLAHSVGWPTFGNDVQVFAEDGTPAPVGEPGEVGVRALTHFDGYLGRPDATEAAWRHGYVMSGDIGIWQPDGRLCIVDRKKDMIISGGENVYTAEVERILHEHPLVLEAAVVGLPDARWGERVAAMVVPRGELDPDDLAGFCRNRLAGYKVPRQIELRDELPRNSMGKVQKFRIVKLLSEPAS
ncbi:MAG: AMP-binding protein [Alphaproteobacteria bacterium]